MTRRIFSCTVTMVMFCCFTACGAAPRAGGGKLSVVATIFAPFDFARSIAGELAEVTMLLPPACESHSFEPTPQDIIKIRNCDVFIYVGGESDAWVERILSAMDTSGMRIVTLMDCVETVEEEIVHGMQSAGESEPEEPERDEHVWTSPINAKRITQKIAAAMCEADPKNAGAYRQNTDKYLKELDDLDRKFRQAVAEGARKTIVFGDRFPFRYFADAYDLDYYAAFPGCAAETEAGARTVIFLIDKIKNEGIPVVFRAELSGENMARTIAKAAGAKVLKLHACHTISQEDYRAGRTYTDLMRDNVAALQEALQ